MRSSQAQQPRPTFRVGVDLVQVDVVVLDADGNPVHGLTKDDFVLIDGNLPQPIATFAELIHDRPPAQVFPPGLPLDVASNQSAKSGSARNARARRPAFSQAHGGGEVAGPAGRERTRRRRVAGPRHDVGHVRRRDHRRPRAAAARDQQLPRSLRSARRRDAEHAGRQRDGHDDARSRARTIRRRSSASFTPTRRSKTSRG